MRYLLRLLQRKRWEKSILLHPDVQTAFAGEEWRTALKSFESPNSISMDYFLDFG